MCLCSLTPKWAQNEQWSRGASVCVCLCVRVHMCFSSQIVLAGERVWTVTCREKKTNNRKKKIKPHTCYFLLPSCTWIDSAAGSICAYFFRTTKQRTRSYLSWELVWIETCNNLSVAVGQAVCSWTGLKFELLSWCKKMSFLKNRKLCYSYINLTVLFLSDLLKL